MQLNKTKLFTMLYFPLMISDQIAKGTHHKRNNIQSSSSNATTQVSMLFFHNFIPEKDRNISLYIKLIRTDPITVNLITKQKHTLQ